MRMLRVVARREHASAGRDLQYVGPVADQLADDLPHLVGAVDERVRRPRVREEDRHVPAARHPGVGVAAGLADHRDGDLHTRAAGQSVLHGLTNSHVRSGRVADGRDADPERRLHVAHRVEELVGERLLHRLEEVDVAEHQVGVTVEEPGEDGLSADVDLLVAVEPGSDLQDPAVLDRDVRVGGLRARPVEDPSSGEDRSRHRTLRPPSLFRVEPRLARREGWRGREPPWRCA
jgi:hypothetical protein